MMICSTVTHLITHICLAFIRKRIFILTGLKSKSKKTNEVYNFNNYTCLCQLPVKAVIYYFKFIQQY